MRIIRRSCLNPDEEAPIIARHAMWQADRLQTTVTEAACDLVPPDHRIIGPEQIDALRRVLADNGIPTEGDFDLLYPLIGDDR